MDDTMGALQGALGYTFADPALLRLALTHRSYVYETPGVPNLTNERLEFLGDAVLAYVAANLLYLHYPQMSEGDLTVLRSVLVRETTLARFARQVRLGDALRLGRGEERNGGREREPILASALEAVLGAVALEAGLDAAAATIHPLLASEIERVADGQAIKDAKSRLQELAQARLGQTPVYRVATLDGPAHQPRFTVEVLVGDLIVALGEGTSKQRAEQDAARHALTREGWRDDETA